MSNKPKLKLKLKRLKKPFKMSILNHVADTQGCGSIRIIFPSIILNQLPDREMNISSMYTNRFSPYKETYTGVSHVVFQRSASQQQYEIIKYMKQQFPSVPIIYEIDDNIIDIPEWNFAAKFFNDNAAIIKNILRTVDGISTSTHFLKKEFLKYNKNIKVVENHLPQYLWGKVVCQVKETQKSRILYAGSANHFAQHGVGGDFSKELIDFVIKTSDVYQWVFVGGIPIELKNNNNIEYYDWVPVISFPSFIKSLECDIMLAPLEINNFNKSKSNIKALESVACGIPLISTRIEPYKNLSMVSDTPEEMISQIETLVDSADQRKYTWEDQWKTLKDQLFWEDNNYKNTYGYLDQYLKLIGYKL